MPTGKPLTTDQKQLMVELHESGLTLMETGQKLGIDAASVWHHLKRMGIPTRKRGKGAGIAPLGNATLIKVAEEGAEHLAVTPKREAPQCIMPSCTRKAAPALLKGTAFYGAAGIEYRESADKGKCGECAIGRSKK